jgi:hypothetical protein
MLVEVRIFLMMIMMAPLHQAQVWIEETCLVLLAIRRSLVLSIG